MNALVSPYDPLIKDINSTTFPVIRRLIKEHAFFRIKHLSQQINDTVHQRAVILITNDAQQKPQQRQKTQRQLKNYLNQLVNQPSPQHQEVIDELMFYLMYQQIEVLLKNPNHTLMHELINNHPLASQLLDAWRLLQLRKWKKVQEIEPTLARIDDNHAAFEMANALRIKWRMYSKDPQQQAIAMRMIDEQLTLMKSSHGLIDKVKLAIKMQKYQVAIATLYELKTLLPSTNNKKGLAIFNQLLSNIKFEAQRHSLYNESIRLNLKKLKRSL